MKNEKGLSLVETMIAVGIIGIVAAGIASSISNLQTENRALQEKLALMDLKNASIKLFADVISCKAQITSYPTTINLSSVTGSDPLENPIPFQRLFAGIGPTSGVIAEVGSSLPGFSGNKMVVKSIEMTNVYYGGFAGNFKGDIVIKIDSDTMVRHLSPVIVKAIPFTVTTMTPGNYSMSSFKDCEPQSTYLAVVAGKTCPGGQFLVGFDATANPICKSISVQSGKIVTSSNSKSVNGFQVAGFSGTYSSAAEATAAAQAAGCTSGCGAYGTGTPTDSSFNSSTYSSVYSYSVPSSGSSYGNSSDSSASDSGSSSSNSSSPSSSSTSSSSSSSD